MSQDYSKKAQEVVDDEELVRFITFTVSGQEYGIDIMSVREIKGWTQTTTLPNTQEYMRGVINLRGAVVPILDLRARFGMGSTETTKNHVVLIVNVEKRVMGILVDTVSDILIIPVGQVRPIPSIDASDDSRTILKGLVNLNNRMVALLQLEKIFDHAIDVHETGDFQFLESNLHELNLEESVQI